jgi:hypothetical protein
LREDSFKFLADIFIDTLLNVKRTQVDVDGISPAERTSRDLEGNARKALLHILTDTLADTAHRTIEGFAFSVSTDSDVLKLETE